jgi:hypothetical protein
MDRNIEKILRSISFTFTNLFVVVVSIGILAVQICARLIKCCVTFVEINGLPLQIN